MIPGDKVNTDQYEFRIKGILPYSKGKDDPKNMYTGGTLFMNHVTRYTKTCNQVSLGISGTVRSKELFGINTSDQGIKVKTYHEDNGSFKVEAYNDDLEKRQQGISYAGVGSHGQDGVVERAIQIVFHSTRIMMLHQALL